MCKKLGFLVFLVFISLLPNNISLSACHHRSCFGVFDSVDSCVYPILTDIEAKAALNKGLLTQDQLNNMDVSSSSAPLIGVTLQGCMLFHQIDDQWETLLYNSDPKDKQIGGCMGYPYLARMMVKEEVCNNKCKMGFTEAQKTDCAAEKDTSTAKDLVTNEACYLPNNKSRNLKYCDTQMTKQYIELCAKYTTKPNPPEKPKSLMVGLCAYKGKDTNDLNWVRIGNADYEKITTPLSGAFVFDKFSTDQTYTPEEPSTNYWEFLDCYPIRFLPNPPPFCLKGGAIGDDAKVIGICEAGKTPSDTTCKAPADGQTHSTYAKPCINISFSPPITNPPIPDYGSKDFCYTSSPPPAANPTFSSTDHQNNTRTFSLNLNGDKTKLCVKEGNNLIRCVNRPYWPKPKVSFCSDMVNIPNTPSKNCMQVFPASSAESDKLKNLCKSGEITNMCAPTSADTSCKINDADKNTTISTCPKTLSSYVSNKCGVGPVDWNNIKNTCVSYTDCCTAGDSTTTIAQCKKEAGFYCSLTGTALSFTGTTKICLRGYAPKPDYTPCTGSNCNRICAEKVIVPTKDVPANTMPSESVCNRTDPSPIPTPPAKHVFGALPVTANCSTAKPPSSIGVRGRSSVENDLCVAIYPFNIDCSKGAASTDCVNQIQIFCSKTTDKKSYVNFDKCVQAYTSCNSNPLLPSKLGNAIPCTEINKIMTAPD